MENKEQKMDFTIAVLLPLFFIWIHLVQVDTVNSTMQDALKNEQWDDSESDIFSIIWKVNKGLIERTGSKVIQHGDILVGTTRNAQVCKDASRKCLWPASKDGNVYVPYIIEKSYTAEHRKLIKRALDEINSVTCIKFYYKRGRERAYISVYSKSGCFATTGYGPNMRHMSLKIPDCMLFGIIAHEFLHALGFQHEQCRNDRDDYITIFWENISPRFKFNFNLLETNNQGIIYDYGSIMHYSRKAFSNNSKATMAPKPENYMKLGQIRGLSTKDVLKINKLYKCDICGNMFIAETGNIESPNFPSYYPNNADCNWIIRAHSKFKILLEFSTFQVYEFVGCFGDHVAIYDGPNNNAKVLDGPTCGAENPAAISTARELLITFKSTRTITAIGFAAKYKFITCGKMLSARIGNIRSRSLRSKDVLCYWVVLLKRFHQVRMKLKGINLKDDINCTENSMLIRDAAQTPPRIAGIYCDDTTLPSNFTSYGRTLVIEFRHKPSRTKRAFQVSYDSVVNRNPPRVFSEGSHSNNPALVLFISLLCSWRAYFM
ncbi:astacin-like metalloendopeptidase [Scyliorhinus canicula]|uniref:astacin-like metalloendopeptidase n=1 Tax=Scyliorhinus canicula TaxID=7830 RepID=UPI0018F34511|nr:astacin-like metalloendopeptidase [Scyliorhinus canicula]